MVKGETLISCHLACGQLQRQSQSREKCVVLLVWQWILFRLNTAAISESGLLSGLRKLLLSIVIVGKTDDLVSSV